MTIFGTKWKGRENGVPPVDGALRPTSTQVSSISAAVAAVAAAFSVGLTVMSERNRRDEERPAFALESSTFFPATKEQTADGGTKIDFRFGVKMKNNGKRAARNFSLIAELPTNFVEDFASDDDDAWFRITSFGPRKEPYSVANEIPPQGLVDYANHAVLTAPAKVDLLFVVVAWSYSDSLTDRCIVESAVLRIKVAGDHPAALMTVSHAMRDDRRTFIGRIRKTEREVEGVCEALVNAADE